MSVSAARGRRDGYETHPWDWRTSNIHLLVHCVSRGTREKRGVSITHADRGGARGDSSGDRGRRTALDGYIKGSVFHSYAEVERSRSAGAQRDGNLQQSKKRPQQNPM